VFDLGFMALIFFLPLFAAANYYAYSYAEANTDKTVAVLPQQDVLDQPEKDEPVQAAPSVSPPPAEAAAKTTTVAVPPTADKKQTAEAVETDPAAEKASAAPVTEPVVIKKKKLILDNLKVHHGKEVTKWVKKNKELIELFYLPAYSPDLNPDEHLNSDLKQGVGSKTPSRSKHNLKRAAEEHLAMLKATPARIREYFKDPAIAYAAI
jgi:transposase